MIVEVREDGTKVGVSADNPDVQWVEPPLPLERCACDPLDGFVCWDHEMRGRGDK